MDRFIRIGKELVSVSEEIYKEYFKLERRERYMENDIKVGRTDVDMKSGITTYIPSKEDSIERLMEQGSDFADDKTFEDIICDKAMLAVLQEAMAELSRDEQELIKSIYYEQLSTREISERENVSQPAIVKKHRKVLNKIKKYFL